MRIFDFEPDRDHVLDGDSLIENTFSADFCVVDEAGSLLSTAHNQNLLRRARLLVESRGAVGVAEVENGPEGLEANVDTVTQRKDLQMVRPELLVRDLEDDEICSRFAGSLA
jgi:hypothetical protein